MSKSLAAACVVVLLGCGSSTGGSSAGGGTGGGSAGGAGGGGTGSGKTGTIALTQIASGTTFSTLETVDFQTLVGTPLGDGCTRTVSGNCTLFDCGPFDAGAADAGPVITHQAAGAIDLLGGKQAITLNPLNGGTANVYGTGTGTTQLWDGTEQLKAKADGGEVPAFTSPNLAAPSLIVVSAPTCGSTCGTINRATALTFTWSLGSTGTVLTALSTQKAGHSKSVSCSFPASANTGTISAAMVGTLDTTLDGGFGTVLVNNSNRTNFTAGSHEVTFSATAIALSKLATFQ